MMTSIGSAPSTVQSMMTPDLVLPEQFFTESNTLNLTGERALQWAVFADGIDTHRRLAHAKSTGARREFYKIRAWIMRDDWETLYSFVNLCVAFGFEPDAVREALVRWEQRSRPEERRRRYRHAA